MTSIGEVLAAAPRASLKGPRRPPGYRHLRGSDFTWTVAFILPYAAVFLAFAVYPIGYALWMARDPALYAALVADPRYLTSLVNTLLFVAFGVNVKMFLALVLSGFFLRRGWWIKAILFVYMLPWVLASVQAFIAFHWMLIGDPGLVDGVLSALTGIEGPVWFNHRWLAIACNIIAYIWKWMPFWTLIFLAGRTAIPRVFYDAAEIDGATGPRRFIHVTVPMLANLYLLCTLLSVIWTLGDFNTVYFVSAGGPSSASDVLTTLGFHYTFETANPALGVAAMMSALPVLVPVVILLLRKLDSGEVQL
ncbi:MAG TPA: sugar ABC transporter permease [Stellaceae bacterium]|nr:sugar ABC transporter permease [Stellaceae bacterium]